ncbi:hypothetical protein HPB51_007126 [Rhipicephalus microplus]|uniref:Uncharacterized protein n=1 Tax=Rhipicephalus microplus TaxID=6941 RepID=A0A9J6E0N8_RHIMP|nr:hypothetical protein HPB51_007126 [Rhipicephalus microplus]
MATTDVAMASPTTVDVPVALAAEELCLREGTGRFSTFLGRSPWLWWNLHGGGCGLARAHPVQSFPGSSPSRHHDRCCRGSRIRDQRLRFDVPSTVSSPPGVPRPSPAALHLGAMAAAATGVAPVTYGPRVCSGSGKTAIECAGNITVESSCSPLEPRVRGPLHVVGTKKQLSDGDSSKAPFGPIEGKAVPFLQDRRSTSWRTFIGVRWCFIGGLHGFSGGPFNVAVDLLVVETVESSCSPLEPRVRRLLAGGRSCRLTVVRPRSLSALW